MLEKDFSVVDHDEPDVYLTPVHFDDFAAVQKKFAFIDPHPRSAYDHAVIFPTLGGYLILADVHFVRSRGRELVEDWTLTNFFSVHFFRII
jgi:hypothetical protein